MIKISFKGLKEARELKKSLTAFISILAVNSQWQTIVKCLQKNSPSI